MSEYDDYVSGRLDRTPQSMEDLEQWRKCDHEWAWEHARKLCRKCGWAQPTDDTLEWAQERIADLGAALDLMTKRHDGEQKAKARAEKLAYRETDRAEAYYGQIAKLRADLAAAREEYAQHYADWERAAQQAEDLLTEGYEKQLTAAREEARKVAETAVVHLLDGTASYPDGVGRDDVHTIAEAILNLARYQPAEEVE